MKSTLQDNSFTLTVAFMLSALLIATKSMRVSLIAFLLVDIGCVCWVMLTGGGHKGAFGNCSSSRCICCPRRFFPSAIGVFVGGFGAVTSIFLMAFIFSFLSDRKMDRAYSARSPYSIEDASCNPYQFFSFDEVVESKDDGVPSSLQSRTEENG